MSNYKDICTGEISMLAAECMDSRATVNLEEKRRTTTRIAMRVPRSCYGEPIITRLSCEHGLIVNIIAALLGESPEDDGWFTLELTGTTQQIQAGIIYLEELDLEIWDKTAVEEESW